MKAIRNLLCVCIKIDWCSRHKAGDNSYFWYADSSLHVSGECRERDSSFSARGHMSSDPQSAFRCKQCTQTGPLLLVNLSAFGKKEVFQCHMLKDTENMKLTGPIPLEKTF